MWLVRVKTESGYQLEKIDGIIDDLQDAEVEKIIKALILEYSCPEDQDTHLKRLEEDGQLAKQPDAPLYLKHKLCLMCLSEDGKPEPLELAAKSKTYTEVACAYGFFEPDAQALHPSNSAYLWTEKKPFVHIVFRKYPEVEQLEQAESGHAFHHGSW